MRPSSEDTSIACCWPSGTLFDENWYPAHWGRRDVHAFSRGIDEATATSWPRAGLRASPAGSYRDRRPLPAGQPEALCRYSGGRYSRRPRWPSIATAGSTLSPTEASLSWSLCDASQPAPRDDSSVRSTTTLAMVDLVSAAGRCRGRGVRYLARGIRRAFRPARVWQGSVGHCPAKRGYWRRCRGQIVGAKRGVFPWNSNLTMMSIFRRPGSTSPLKSVYCVAAGFKPYRILNTHGFDGDTRVVLFDYSPRALEFRHGCSSEWDGADLPRVPAEGVPRNAAGYLLPAVGRPVARPDGQQRPRPCSGKPRPIDGGARRRFRNTGISAARCPTSSSSAISGRSRGRCSSGSGPSQTRSSGGATPSSRSTATGFLDRRAQAALREIHRGARRRGPLALSLYGADHMNSSVNSIRADEYAAGCGGEEQRGRWADAGSIPQTANPKLRAYPPGGSAMTFRLQRHPSQRRFQPSPRARSPARPESPARGKSSRPRYDSAVGLFDLDLGTVDLLGYHEHLANRIVVNPAGTLAASSSSDYTIGLWDLERRGDWSACCYGSQRRCRGLRFRRRHDRRLGFARLADPGLGPRHRRDHSRCSRDTRKTCFRWSASADDFTPRATT